jgi:hypothetical protein
VKAQAPSSAGSRSNSFDSTGQNPLSSPASSHFHINEEPQTQDINKKMANLSEDDQKKKNDMMKKLKPDPNAKANQVEIKGERKVRDPVTGKEVIIKDAAFEGNLFHPVIIF